MTGQAFFNRWHREMPYGERQSIDKETRSPSSSQLKAKEMYAEKHSVLICE